MSTIPTFPLSAWGDPLSTGFFNRSPLEVAPDLLGRVLASVTSDGAVAGVIVETEAYLGRDDPGSHASTRGVTKRNAVMYGAPGTVYVYFTYGNHHMINLVCEREGLAGAVLVRALEPVYGADLMSRRRGGLSAHNLCTGPGKLAQALGIDLSDNGSMLGQGRLQVYTGEPAKSSVASGRVGLNRGHDLEYRFYIESNAYVSKGRLGPTGTRRTKG